MTYLINYHDISMLSQISRVFISFILLMLIFNMHIHNFIISHCMKTHFHIFLQNLKFHNKKQHQLLFLLRAIVYISDHHLDVVIRFFEVSEGELGQILLQSRQSSPGESLMLPELPARPLCGARAPTVRPCRGSTGCKLLGYGTVVPNG